MKKYIKFILGFIVGGIICTSIGVYATITYTASQIKYTKSNNQEVTLDSALNELYTNIDSVSDLQSQLNAWNNKTFNFGTPSYNTSQGTYIPTRTASVSVSKGKYLIVKNETTGWNMPSSSTSYSASHGVSTKTIACQSNNCNIRQLTGYYNQPITGEFGSYKFIVSNAYNLFIVDINNDSDVITSSMGNGSSTYNDRVQYATLSAIPISYS